MSSAERRDKFAAERNQPTRNHDTWLSGQWAISILRLSILLRLVARRIRFVRPMESNRLENDPPIQTALDNESPKRGKRRDEANDREVTRRDEKRKGEEEIKIGKKKGTRESVGGSGGGDARRPEILSTPQKLGTSIPRSIESRSTNESCPCNLYRYKAQSPLPVAAFRIALDRFVSLRIASFR